ncbi:tyrosine-type recombinase/integrase [Rhizobium giardinii]|uniref:tyrosine-type recombinase/integrase n=1 Tax=Rhizobium giardinii TaxID=56731 RepID=UPI0039DF3418
MLPYTQQLPSGKWRYRRPVPDRLKPIVAKRNLIKKLGGTYAEALNAYPKVHAEFELLIRKAEQVLTAEAEPHKLPLLTKLELYLEGIAKVRRMGFDPHDAVVDLDDLESVAEDAARTYVADAILEEYPKDPGSGDPVGVTKMDEFVVRALNSGAPPAPEPTLEDAKKLYIAERVTGTEAEIKKKVQRLDRITGYIETALGRPPTIPQFSRTDAKLVRDHMLSGTLKPSSVKRDLNVVKAMFNHIITEMQLAGCMNPFAKLPIAGLNEDPEDELRDPLPDDILQSVRRLILNSANEDLQLVWRLLEGTGCRLAEVTGLRVEDIVLGDDYPHLMVTWHEGRRIKTNASKREVPLVGDALDAAKEAVAIAKERTMLFARYGKESGPTNASASLMKYVRKITEDTAHAVHSLRHNMKDRLILAEVGDTEQNLILGHSLGGVGNRYYGGDRAKLRAITKAMKRAFGVEEIIAAVEA